MENQFCVIRLTKHLKLSILAIGCAIAITPTSVLACGGNCTCSSTGTPSGGCSVANKTGGCLTAKCGCLSLNGGEYKAECKPTSSQ